MPAVRLVHCYAFMVSPMNFPEQSKDEKNKNECLNSSRTLYNAPYAKQNTQTKTTVLRCFFHCSTLTFIKILLAGGIPELSSSCHNPVAQEV